jgi:hypothetical protein
LERDQPGKLLLLFGDPVRGPCFIPGARKRGSLFDQPSYVLPDHCNAFFK